jgi:hypothetical protein
LFGIRRSCYRNDNHFYLPALAFEVTMQNTDANVETKDVTQMDTGEGVREAVREIRRVLELTNKIDARVQKIEARQSGWIRIWVWFKSSIAHAAEDAKKIHLD